MEALNKLPWAAKSPIFKKVSEISDISALSREERMKYDHAIKSCFGHVLCKLFLVTIVHGSNIVLIKI